MMAHHIEAIEFWAILIVVVIRIRIYLLLEREAGYIFFNLASLILFILEILLEAVAIADTSVAFHIW